MSLEKTDRRTFHLSAIYGLWGLITAALASPAVAYLLFPPKTRKGGEWVEVGDVSQLREGLPKEMVYRRNRVDGWKMTSEKSSAWVVKLAGNEVVAYSPQCTHLGCAYHWEERKGDFLCPCHTSTFSIDGKVTAGPAPRPLDRFAVRVEGSKILLGPLKRSDAA